MLGRTLRAVLPCVVLVPLLTACGGAGSGGAGERPSVTASFSPTRERPTPTGTTPTRTPAGPDTSAPTGSPLATSSASSTPAASSAGGGDEQTSAEDWWWLLIPILVAAVIGLLLVRHARRTRHAWESRLAIAQRETGWFAGDLIPQLRRSGSPAGVTGGWAVAAPRVTTLDDRLSELVSTAPGDGERARASALQEAVRAARDRVVAVVGAGDRSTQWALDLDDAQAPLLVVLVAPSTNGDGASGAQ